MGVSKKMAPSEEEIGTAPPDSLKKCDFNAIQLLLKAPSKEVVKKILQESYNFMHSKVANVPDNLAEKTAEALAVSPEEASSMITALSMLLKDVLFEGLTHPREVYTVFPGDFHKSLRELLSKLIADEMSVWKSDTISRQVSLPRLVDFDWRIDVKTGSSGRMSIPSCLLQLKVNNDVSSGDIARQESKNVNVELTKETLDTMLDGLGKIRDQLNSVVAR